MTSLLVDQSIPLELFQAVSRVQGNTAGLSRSNEDRYWLSNGRKMSDPTWDIITVQFKSAASISLISFELLAVGCEFEVWYRNRAGKRLPVLDQSLRQFTGKISSSQIDNQWINWTRNIYPVVATAIEMRFRRIDDGVFAPDSSVSIGVRNTYFKRNIYGREDTVAALDSGVDSMGNSIQRTIKDWDASKARDGSSTTFWKCEPQPDPNAVVCFYLDGRSESNNAQRVDRLWLDPVYTGQAMNVYYSNDETIGTRKLSKIRQPSLDSSVNWLFDSNGLNLKNINASYNIDSIALGQFNLTDPGMTIMGTWIPDFEANNPPATNLYLIRNESQSTASNNIQVLYNVGTNRMNFVSGGVTVQSEPMSFQAGSAVSFAAVTGETNWLMIYQANNYKSITTNNSITTHTDRWGNTFQLKYNAGWMKDLVIRQGYDKDLVDAFMANPTVFLTPDNAPQDSITGVVPSTTLDNVIYGADFTSGQHGFGGLDYNFFTEKNWVPVFKDWTTYRGFYYFPLPISAKYWKLEFSELIAESYPIYETGIEVTYQSFPISVIKTSKSLVNTSANTTSVNTQVNSSINGLLKNSTSSLSTYQSATTDYAPDTEIVVGTGVFNDVPRSFDTPISESFQKEVSSSSFSSTNTQSSSVTNYIENVSYTQKQVTNTVSVAKDAYYTVVKGDWLIKIAARYNIDWHVIYEMNKDLIKLDPRVKKLPSRPEGWWIFPGQQLRIPGVIMENITQTSTVTERVVSTTADVINTAVTTTSNTTNTATLTTARARFTTTQVHRYEVKTAKRDAAIAYFTGLREVQLFTVNYITAEDTSEYEIYGTDFASFTNAATNFSLLSDNSWRPSTFDSVKSLVNSSSWNSTSPFVKLKIELFGNPIYREVSGISNLSPIASDVGDSAFWSTDVVSWGSASSFWGATRPLGSAAFNPGVSFDGESAMRIIREATVTSSVIGVKTPVFQFPAQLGLTRITVVYNSSINRLESGSNQYRLEIIDPTNEVTPLYSELVSPGPVNKWNTFTTHFYSPPDARNVYIRMVTSGVQKETLHIGNLYTQTYSSKLEVSNNNGTNYYDATSALNNPDTFFVFPSPGNQLKFRYSAFGAREHIYGIKLTPYYLF